ncbi:hypothetical protein, partial [Blastomonas sp. UPD001]|uniref:hypothetical protein n=1 Tax=Blastomonas sp. UPD001 TaxID=2217673 RepID=UPI0018E52769
MAGIEILAVAYALAAPGAAEARLPDAITLCDRPASDLPAAVLPLASDRATRARSLMRGGDNGADAALALLLSPVSGTSAAEAAQGERASLAQLAEYCLVAGEAMRRARSGSQARAQDFLRTAQALAEQAGDKALAARAAWEAALAMAGGAPPTASGTRRRSA